VQEVGTHSVMLVQLDEICVREHGDSLVYFSRGFHRLQRAVQAA
jgi:flavin reductase (NADH)